MQQNVDKLLAAATASTFFNLVQDRIFDETDKYPAFLVVERRNKRASQDSRESAALGGWRYKCHVILNDAGFGWTDLEGATKAFLDQLQGDDFEVVYEYQYEATISGKDVLVNTIVLETFLYANYG